MGNHARRLCARLKVGFPLFLPVAVTCLFICVVFSRIFDQFTVEVLRSTAVEELSSLKVMQGDLRSPPNTAHVFHSQTPKETQTSTRSKLPALVNVTEKLKTKLEPSKILIWTKFWSGTKRTWEKVFYRHFSKKCPVTDCNLLFDHDDLKEADAVLFNLVNYKSSKVPPVRIPEQLYVAISFESPGVVMRRSKLENTADFFNLTMTYRRDSDIVVPYGRLIPRESPLSSANDHDYWTEKKNNKTIVWFVSDCRTHSKREDYVKELQRYIPVDIYGSCGPLRCGTSTIISRGIRSDPCETILESYMFYLSFENNICWDYVTEKLYRALSHSTIPIVFGGTNYSDIIPPGSYINALDYLNPKDLADYVKKVASTPDLFNSYHRWKSLYTVEIGQPFSTFVCDLCAWLHGRTEDIEFPTKPLVRPDGRVVTGRKNGSYPDFYRWFIEEGQCVYWNKTTMSLVPWRPQRKHSP